MIHVVLSLGSNIDREANIRYAIREIESRYGRLDISPIYETSAVGFDGPPFYNLVAGMWCDAELPEIIECHRVTGEDSLVLRVAVADVAHLEALVDRVRVFGELTTSIILSTLSQRDITPAMFDVMTTDD